MTTKVLDSLISWDEAVRPKQQARRWAGDLWVKPRGPMPAKVVKRASRPANLDECQIAPPPHPKYEWVAHVGTGKGAEKPATAEAMASCQLIRFDGDEAECKVTLLGFEMPSVNFPAWVLRANKLREGDRFYWIMRDNGQIGAADIDTEVATSPASAKLSSAERGELAKLIADSRRREAEGEEWEEYTGDGR